MQSINLDGAWSSNIAYFLLPMARVFFKAMLFIRTPHPGRVKLLHFFIRVIICCTCLNGKAAFGCIICYRHENYGPYKGLNPV
jgi:hypothetical protein